MHFHAVQNLNFVLVTTLLLTIGKTQGWQHKIKVQWITIRYTYCTNSLISHFLDFLLEVNWWCFMTNSQNKVMNEKTDMQMDNTNSRFSLHLKTWLIKTTGRRNGSQYSAAIRSIEITVSFLYLIGFISEVTDISVK